MKSYLIYHPKREVKKLNGITVYHDNFEGNQDPYIWNEKFLHTYCHITQMTNEEGQYNFWVSADKLTGFTHLYCDCVFVVDEKIFWTSANQISLADKIVDNPQTFEHHYQWANFKNHHTLARRRRYTLKAHPENSFQPQDKDHKLIDIVPFLNKLGISIEQLRAGLTAKIGAKPFQLPDGFGEKLYDYLNSCASIKLKGSQLAALHPNGVNLNPSDPSSKCC